MEAPPENFAYTLLLSPDFSKPDALAVIDVKPDSSTYSQIVHTVTMPNKGDEFHHFGWNACSSALSPLAGHAFLERRYLIIPGIRSSRIYIVDTKPDPTQAKIHKIIEPEEIFRKTGYSRPHTIHCGPEGIYVSTLGGGGKDGTDGPPGVFIMDCETFEVLGRWEIDRGPQTLHYDFWWNLPRDYMVTSEWALPPQFENGIVPEDLLSNKYGHRIHFWDLRARRNVQTIDLGANHQMALEVRPAHDPVREYGFLGVVVDTTNLEGSIWTWWREGGKFHIEKTATIPPEPASKDQLPPLLQGFGAVPPLVTDIDSVDGRQVSLRLLLGHRRDASIRCHRSAEAEACRIGPHRRHRATHAASERQGLCRRSADGRDQPRRQARLLDQLALFDLGRPVLSGWCSGRRGDGQRKSGRRARTGQGLLGRASPTDIGRIRSGSTAVTARPIHSAIRRSEFERKRIDDGLALAGGHRERPLSRRQPGNGVAARRFGGIDGTELALRCWRRSGRWRPATCWRCCSCCFRSRCSSPSSNGSARSRSAPASLSSASVSSGLSTGAIHGRWRGYRRRNWGSGRSRLPSPMARRLMLVPIYLGLCREADLDTAHAAAGTLMNANLGMAVLVAIVHATAMIAAGGCLAWLVYRYLGLKFVSRSWFNLDTAWAVSLILVGVVALGFGLAE